MFAQAYMASSETVSGRKSNGTFYIDDSPALSYWL